MGQFVNQELMTELGVSFSLGADILSKGNRTVEKLLGSDKMSGDTVAVTVNGVGKVYENTLDLTGRKGKMGLQRGSVKVSVRPIGIAAEVSEGELALACKMPEAMDKFTAQLQERVNQKAFRALLGSSQAFVANVDSTMTSERIDRGIRQAAFDAEGNTTTSKWTGNTQGICHPQTWNRVVPSLMGNYGGNDRRGDSLYKNELGDFLGFDWTKGMDTLRIEAASLGGEGGVSQITIGVDGELTVDIADIHGFTGSSDGEIFPMPFRLKQTIEGKTYYITTVDGLGGSTGWKKTFHFKWEVLTWDSNYEPLTGHWVLANPIFLAGPRKNASFAPYDQYVSECTIDADKHGFINPDYNWYEKNEWNRIHGTHSGSATPTSWTFTVEDVLADGVTYLAPMVMFKEPDFLIAVKGLEKRPGSESFTIPTKYAEKGIMPWRGTYWNDDYKSLSLFRVDSLMGFNTYSGVSMSSVYIPFID